MSCENFFCRWGCGKEARANSQDHSGKESIPDDVSMTGLKAPEHKKRLKNYQKSLKLVPDT